MKFYFRSLQRYQRPDVGFKVAISKLMESGTTAHAAESEVKPEVSKELKEGQQQRENSASGNSKDKHNISFTNCTFNFN